MKKISDENKLVPGSILRWKKLFFDWINWNNLIKIMLI